jgi:hypothetical protein
MAFGTIKSYSNVASVPDIPGARTSTQHQTISSGLLPTQGLSGLFTNTLPINEIPVTNLGQVQSSFMNDYYYRVIYDPTQVDFGVVEDATTRPVTLWNLYPENQVVTNAQFVNAPNITIQQSIPLTLRPYEVRTFVLSTDVDGPATIAGSLTFTYSIGPQGGVPLLGTRQDFGIPLPEPHNWNVDYISSYDYKTEIIQTRSKREQRIAARDRPRRRYRQKLFFSHDNLALMQARSYDGKGLIFTVPEVTNFSYAPAISQGQSVATFSTVPVWVVAGQNVFIEREINKVFSVAGNVVTFSKGFTSAHPAGVKMYAARTCRINEIAMDYVTNAVAEATPELLLIPNKALPVPTSAPGRIFDGREMLLTKHNWLVDSSVTTTNNTELLDIDWGNWSFFRPVAFNDSVTRCVFRWFNTTDADKLLNFFHRMKGMRGEFWRPTFEHDIKMITPCVTGEYTIIVAGQSLGQALGQSVHHKAIFIQFRDGSDLAVKVTSIVVQNVLGAPNTIITVQDQWTRTFNDDDVVAISWCFLSRFASDLFEQQWKTEDKGDVTVAIQRLKYEPSE